MGKRNERRVLVVSSGGGHWVEALRLRPAFEGCEVAWASVEAFLAADVTPERFHRVLDVTRWNKVRWLVTVGQLIRVLHRERPNVIVSTGALPGFLCVLLGRVLGIRTVWLDSFANVEQLSMSGQLAGRVVDLWLTQWPHLAVEGGPEFRGKVF